MPTIPELDVPIRASILADSSITSLLPAYKNSYPIFTRRPVPTDAPFPHIVIFSETDISHDDGVDDQRLTVIKEVTVYGSAHSPPEQWRIIDEIGRRIALRFHRQVHNLIVDNWKVVNITVGSRGFPPHDILAQAVGAVVVLSIDLAARNT